MHETRHKHPIRWRGVQCHRRLHRCLSKWQPPGWPTIAISSTSRHSEIDCVWFCHWDSTKKKPCAASFNFVYTKPDDIEKIIRNLKPKSSAGCDNISTKLLKEIENVISRPLSIIINQSLCTGIFPEKLEIAKVIPLYKKDDDRSFGNYRPISLLSSISKIFERVAFNQLYEYFTSNGLLYESQYGFRKLHSTELAALEFTDRISQEMDAKKIPFSIFLDLSKAFDIKCY